VAVRESLRARRPRIVVHHDRGPEVVVPRGAPEVVVDRLLAHHHDWLGRQIVRLDAERRRTSAALGLDRPGVVWVAGLPRPVLRVGGASARARLTADGLEVTGHGEAAVLAVARWYREEARRAIVLGVVAEARRLGARPGRVAVRDQRTRWGSCSASGALSFSWRLLLAPAPVLRYVVVHELCHLWRHDHSSAFWSLVEDAMPDWSAHAGWLRAHSLALQAYEPATALAGRAV
jgi:predicted metal-dependent hydrolase